MIERSRRESASLRVPETEPGRAIVVTRYHSEKAIVLHPDDFRRLALIDAALEELELEPELTALALAALDLEDRPDAALEDPAAIRALLGL